MMLVLQSTAKTKTVVLARLHHLHLMPHHLLVLLLILVLLRLQTTEAFVSPSSQQHSYGQVTIILPSNSPLLSSATRSRLRNRRQSHLCWDTNGSRSRCGSRTSFRMTTTGNDDDESDDFGKNQLQNQLLQEAREVAACSSIAAQALLKKDASVTAQDIVQVCDELDEEQQQLQHSSLLFVNRQLNLRRLALEYKRYELLAKLLRTDYTAYVATASFLSPSRIPRAQLPNVQDVPYTYNTNSNNNNNAVVVSSSSASMDKDDATGAELVADCQLDDVEYQDSWLDSLLLSIFRKLVKQNTGGVTSPTGGILGLLDQGRQFMLQPDQTPEAQHQMVYNTLKGLMTPVLPPFYRIFMSGILPKNIDSITGGGDRQEEEQGDNDKIPASSATQTTTETIQLGPWFYAPLLTALVTPTFFKFLVGPSRPNRRKDGQYGGLLVEKCKFLQESGCKGLCLHQCKLPAQQFFAQELGLPLTVSPNFVTQECQWSFGETPLPPQDDPSFPRGCLAGCQSRRTVASASAMMTGNDNKKKADLCSA